METQLSALETPASRPTPTSRASVQQDRRFDVAVLGSGIGGAELGTILARHGVRVLIVEEASHPRFAIGEATVPESTTWHRLMAERFSVPELGHLGRLQKMLDHVSSQCGTKRNFTFLYHREGEQQRALETTQLNVMPPPWGPDVHMYRQDVDAYLTNLAVRYGAVVRQRTSIAELAFDAQGVELKSTTGERFSARYLVDASGYRSLVAKNFQLRDDPPRTKTNTRTMFTHMVGVKPYDKVGHPRSAHGLPSPFFQGTLHHVTKYGWLWVIHFNNHANSTNPLCSVGLTLDRRTSPKGDRPPAEEFWEFVAKFPSVAKHFEEARPVREWVSTDRLQYSSHSVLGDGFCLMPHAAGFIDPIFSGGMSITASCCAALSDRLIQAVRDDDFSKERFAYVEKLVMGNLSFYDRLVSCTFDSFRSFDLWNAWQRIWIIGSTLGPAGLLNLELLYHETGDRSVLKKVEEYPYSGMLGSGLREFQELFNEVASEIEAMREDKQSTEQTVERIYAHYRRVEHQYPPMLHLTDPARRYPFTVTPLSLLPYVWWGKTKAPDWFRKYYLTYKFRTAASVVTGALLKDVRRSLGAGYGKGRDYFASWNWDWA